MATPIDLLTEQALLDIREEMMQARQEFPTNHHVFTALVEEVGEVGRALLEREYNNGPVKNVYNECIQVAVMAIRLAVEGDHTFIYELGPIK